jgi:hypothetical protein
LPGVGRIRTIREREEGDWQSCFSALEFPQPPLVCIITARTPANQRPASRVHVQLTLTGEVFEAA